MGCVWSSTDESSADATAKFHFLSRRFALAIRRDFVTAYNKLSPDAGMRFEDFSDKKFRRDEEREKKAFGVIGVPKDLEWFVRYYIQKGPVSLPPWCTSPELSRVLCDLGDVDAPLRVKRDFVDLSSCIFKANMM
jgi:hypothetical protein